MLVTLGRIGRAHGLRGEVTVEVRTDDPFGRFDPGSVLRTDPGSAGPLTVASVKAHSGRLLLTFDGVADRTAAEALRGVLLQAVVDPDERPADPDEYFDHQLVGLAAVTTSGESVGQVAEVLHLSGQDCLAIRTPAGREVLVPFVESIVPVVDIEGRRIVIAPPDGLLELSG